MKYIPFAYYKIKLYFDCDQRKSTLIRKSIVEGGKDLPLNKIVISHTAEYKRKVNVEHRPCKQ